MNFEEQLTRHLNVRHIKDDKTIINQNVVENEKGTNFQINIFSFENLQ